MKLDISESDAKTLDDARAAWGGRHGGYRIIMAECAEVIAELCKLQRIETGEVRGDELETRELVADELGDLLVVLCQACRMFGLELIEIKARQKMERLASRVNTYREEAVWNTKSFYD